MPLQVTDLLTQQFQEVAGAPRAGAVAATARRCSCSAPTRSAATCSRARCTAREPRWGSPSWPRWARCSSARCSAAWAGLAGGRVDAAVGKVGDVLLVLPLLYAIVALRTALPLVLPLGAVVASLALIFVALGWPRVARGVQAIVRVEAQQEHVLAAAALGASRWRLLTRHLLPACAGFLAVQTALLVPTFVLAEATLSYVGLGFPDGVPSWGTALTDAANVAALTRAPWTLAPAGAIFAVVLVTNLLLDPAREDGAAAGARRASAESPAPPARRAVTLGQWPSLAGLYTPIVTPFRNDTVDDAAIRRNVERYMQTRLTGLVVLGSNGEAVLLDDGEADRVIAAARSAMPAARPLIAGTGAESTKATIAACKRAANLGADARAGADAVVLQEHDDDRRLRAALRRRGRRIAGAGAALQRDDVHRRHAAARCRRPARRASQRRRHQGLGHRHRPAGRLRARRRARTSSCCRAAAPPTSPAWSPAPRARSWRWPGSSPITARRSATWCGAGRLDEARALQRRLTPLARTIGGLHGVPALKAALDLMGYDGGLPRPPLRPTPKPVIETLRRQLTDLGVPLLEPAPSDADAAFH